MKMFETADVTGDGSSHTLSDLLGIANDSVAKWFQITTVAVATNPTRIGSSSVSISRGVPVPGGGAQFSPPLAEATSKYQLGQIYAWIDSGDTVSISYAI